MTFDDGPSATLTPKLLDLLAAHHIKATFFVIGENVAEHPEIVARAAREGHEIANHSWSHPNFGKMSDESVRRQLQQTDDAIKNATGKRPTLMRPPYGSITAREKRWIHDEFGYDIILWDVDPYDWKRPGPAVVRARILKETRPGSIVLSHDIHPGTIEAMPSTFDELEAKGFKFVTVSELINMATPADAASAGGAREKPQRKPLLCCSSIFPAASKDPHWPPPLPSPASSPSSYDPWRHVESTLLLCGADAAICHSLLVLTTRNDQMVIFAVASPRTRRHITNFDKLPVGHVGRRQSQVIAHRG